jgi:adenylate cyclase
LIPHHLAVLADAYGTAGRPEEGLPLLREAIAIAERTGEGFAETEIHCLTGDLLQMAGAGADEVEHYYRKTLEVARGQHARSWELRATMRLARLWQAQSKREQARASLAEIYGRFTEGFDTLDLQEARALLEALG